MSDSILPPAAAPDGPPELEAVVRLMRREFGAPGEDCSCQCRRLGERRLAVELRWEAGPEKRRGVAYLVEGEEAVLLARDREDVLEVRLRGDIRAAAAANLVDLFVDALACGRRRFIVDVDEASWLGSDAQGALESLVRSLRREGEPFRLEVRPASSWPGLLDALDQDREHRSAEKEQGVKA